MPIFGVIRETFEREGGSMSGDDDFFSVASTIPLVAVKCLAQGSWSRTEQLVPLPFIPNEVTPWFTAFNAYSIPRHISWQFQGRFTNGMPTYLDELSTV